MDNMTLSKYCRQGNIDLHVVSKASGIFIKDLYIIYMNNLMEFENIVNKYSD